MFDLLPDKEVHYDGLTLVYCNVASTNLLKKEFYEAIKFYKIALKVTEGLAGEAPRQAQIFTNIGKIYKNLKSKKEALHYLEQADVI